RSMQLILQATHGVVSGAPAFFSRAFGDSTEAFEGLLLRPHHYIFNREWYERLGGRAEFEEYSRTFRRLTDSQRQELVNLLSSCDPRNIKTLKPRDSQLKRVIPYYIPLSKEKEAEVWARQKATVAALSAQIPDDERVEDAGLNDPVILNGRPSPAMVGAVQ